MPRQTLTRNYVTKYSKESQLPAFTAATTSQGNWIDGTATGFSGLYGYGWNTVSVAASASAQFDTATTYEGLPTLKLALANSTGAITVSNYKTLNQYVLFPVNGSTSVTLKWAIKGENVATNGAFMEIREYNTAMSLQATQLGTKLSGTFDFTGQTATFTTNANTRFLAFLLRHNVTGNVANAWFSIPYQELSVSRTQI